MLLRGFSFFYLMDLVSPEKNSTPFVNFMCFIPYVHYSGFIDTRNYNKMAGNTRARPSLPVGETSMPALGLGLYRPTDVQTLSIALKHGYRHFNTAFSYSIGELQRKTMAKWIEEKIVRREDIFFTADIHVGMSAYHISNAMVYSPFGDYVDLCLLHLPDYTKNITTAEKIFKTQHVQMTDTVLMAYWMKAEEILQAKKARLIGLANFSFEQINLIINHGRIKPNVVQIPFHPYFQNNKIIELCEQNQILVSSYLPLPESALYDYLSNRELDILITQDPLLQTIGAMHGKTPMQIALRYAFERNMTVTTTTGSEEQMIHNMQIFDFSLTEENMKMLRALDPPNNANESNNGN